jgi:hypothetical protein
MVDLIATGHSWSGGGGPITLTPLGGLLLTLMLARWSLGLRVSPAMLGVCVFLGTLFAIAAETWGLTMTTSLWVLAALVSGRVRHTRGTFGRNFSD